MLRNMLLSALKGDDYMDEKGYDAIKRAVACIPADVSPEPYGINERYVTITSSSDVAPARVLSFLQKAGLMAMEGPSDIDRPVTLEPKGVQPGSITLEDLQFPKDRLW